MKKPISALSVSEFTRIYTGSPKKSNLDSHNIVNNLCLGGWNYSYHMDKLSSLEKHLKSHEALKEHAMILAKELDDTLDKLSSVEQGLSSHLNKS